MAKIMLVEDDKNLSEIYEARLAAEGYEIVSAQDGEEALAMAVKERPDLIISDVMMPKISGFDMLDILRTTPETKHTKVVMMTALSQAEDKARADKLGADYYLVKSQATLEDIARVAHNILEGRDPGAPAGGGTPSVQPAPSAPTTATTPPAEQPQPVPAQSSATPITITTPDDTQGASSTDTTTSQSATASDSSQDTDTTSTSNDELVAKAVNELMSQVEPVTSAPRQQTSDNPEATTVRQGAATSSSSPETDLRSMGSHSHNRVIQPLTPGLGSQPDINELAAKEAVTAETQSQEQPAENSLTGWSMDAPEPTPAPDDMAADSPSSGSDDSTPAAA